MILFRTYLFLLLTTVPFSLFGQLKNEQNAGDLFDNEQPLELTFILNCDSLYNGGVQEYKEYKAVLSYKKGLNDKKDIPLKISKRGHFRKMFNVCDFPPLRLEFSKKATENTIFQGFHKLKLVTHCINSDTLFDQYVIQEYLIYKAYQIITEYSFKVRLARIRYVDNSGKNPDLIRYGFFIENTGNLASRVKGDKLGYHYIYPEVLDQYHFYLTGLFQFMIFNTDWSVNLVHNVDLVGLYPALRPIAIPFDFDMAGLINIPYKSPILAYKEGKAIERQFTIKKVNHKLINTAIRRYISKEQQILTLYTECPFLSEANKIKTLSLLTAFFRIIKDKEQIKLQFYK